MTINTGLFSSAKQTWETPQAFFDKLNDEFAFTLDVCAEDSTAKCARYFTKEKDALIRDWAPEVCWMNPPYGRSIGSWIRKAWFESTRGATVVCLIPARTDTSWWHEFVMAYSEIRYVRGRLKFGGAKNGAPFPCAVVIFRPKETPK